MTITAAPSAAYPSAPVSDLAQYGQAMGALVLVIGLLLACAWAAKYAQRRFGLGGMHASARAGQIRIESAQFLDAKTRLVLVRRGPVAHLLCLQAGQPVQVIERSIAWQDDATDAITSAASAPMADAAFAGEDDHAA